MSLYLNVIFLSKCLVEWFFIRIFAAKSVGYGKKR